MRAVTAPVGSVVIDSMPFSQNGTREQAQALRQSGVDAVAGYLGILSKDTLQRILDAGMGYLPVTVSGEYLDGAQDELNQLKALGLVGVGVTVFADMEGLKAFKSDPAMLIQSINDWADLITRNGYIPGLYVGVPQPLTSDELWKLNVQRYWKGQGSVRDRYNNLAEPTGCGWCMTQMFPSVVRGGTLVDCNMVGQDYKGRVPAWAAR